MASSSPQFFRFLLQKNLEDGKLMIPKKFVKEHGKFLSSCVRLKVPDEMEWKVGLKRGPNGVVWMEKGWHKFTQHYNLEYGSLLIFKLDGSSSFETTIFDPTGVETEYCCNFRPQFEEEEEEEEISDCDESSESFPLLLPKKRNKTHLQTRSQSRKKFKVSNGDSFSIKTEPQEDEWEPSLKMRMGRDGVGVSRRKQQFANKGKAEKKPCFKVAMRQSNVAGRFNLIIPKEFADEYLSEDFGIIKLQTVNGKNWSLLYKWSRGNFAYISSGWKSFAQRNNLKKGDVGVFELVKKDTFLFKLLQEDAPPSPLRKKTGSCSSSARNPFFEVELCLRSHKKAIMNIPLPFAKKHFCKEMQSAAELKVGNKQWIVRIKKYNNAVRFSAGWSAFYGDNALKDGDTCLFEMVNKTKCVFQVTIFRKL